MSDMISRGELLKLFPVDMENPLWHFTGIRAAIEAAPTIAAVPVVRCKDCIYRDQSMRCIALYYGFNPYDEWFCANGARMDGEAE